MIIAAISSIVFASVLDFVDPFVGTEYTGNTFPGPSRPFGLVQPSPDTGHGTGWYASGYKRLDETVFGFSQTHLSGMGCGDLGDVLVLPFVGQGPIGTNEFFGAKDNFQERAKVGYYSVVFTNFNIKAEVAAGQRVGFYRWTYPEGETPKVLVDLQWGTYDRGPAPQLRNGNENKFVLLYDGKLGKDGCSLVGTRVTDGWMRGRRVSWKLKFSKKWKSAVWEDDPFGGKAGRYVFEFEKDDTPLECRVAISANTIEAAERNFDAEGGMTFDEAVKTCQDEWEELLNRAKFETEDVSKKRILYTGLYHSDLQPIDMADAGEEPLYSNFSTWDTFRSVHAMYNLIVPERVNGFINSMLVHYKKYGCLPIHACFGIENYCMVAVHSVPIITEAYLKGFRGYDTALALEAVTNSLTVSHIGYPREDWDLLDKYGYIPFDKVFNQSASRTLEVAYDDACVAKMAAAMGNKEVYQRFEDRSWAWTNIFDRSVGFIRGKDSAGNWHKPFDPAETGLVAKKDFDFTEGSSWTYTWHIMQHPEALIEAIGKEKAGEMLDTFFREPERYDHGNEPGHHIIYMYQYAGKPWAAERMLRKISTTYHFATGDGITGNDDCGQVSCWYMFTALGFYPVDPSSLTYVIGAPQIDRAELTLSGGKTFTMIAHDLSESNKYVKRVLLNGKPLEGFLLKHEDIINGGTLEFEMSATPSGGIPGVRNEQLPPNSWPSALRVQPEPDGILPCFKDWRNKPVEVAAWQEIVRKWTKDAFAGAVYGVRPVERPQDLEFKVLDEKKDVKGKVVCKRVRITYGGPGGRDSFDIVAYMPVSERPVGAFVMIRNEGEEIPYDMIVGNGYAAIEFEKSQVCPDCPDYKFDQKAHRVYSPNGRSSRSWGAVSAWAWGASRVMDWVESQPGLNASQVAVVGCAQAGKAALWAAASDTRFAMACVNDSGVGGAKLNRIRLPEAEDVAWANINNPHWFTLGWQRYNGREEQFGLDAHDLVALVAPRLLAIGSASEDFASGPVGEFATAKYGSLAWEKFGLKGIREFAFPAPGEVISCGNVSYHLRNGARGIVAWDWERFLDFADKHNWMKASK